MLIRVGESLGFTELVAAGYLHIPICMLLLGSQTAISRYRILLFVSCKASIV